MEQGTDDSVVHFDLRAASARLSPYTSRRRRVLVIGMLFLVAFGSFFSVIDASAIATRSLSTVGAIGLAAILGTVIGGICLSIPTIIKLKAGATVLTVGRLGFELDYPDGSRSTTEWSDPGVSFELFDSSRVAPSKLLTQGMPYSISVGGVHSLLTAEAFAEMMSAVRRHCLEDSPSLGSRWVYTAQGNPVIHHIRAPARGPR
jgi:hypothetical protein